MGKMGKFYEYEPPNAKKETVEYRSSKVRARL